MQGLKTFTTESRHIQITLGKYNLLWLKTKDKEDIEN
jgi:hypothetical protein